MTRSHAATVALLAIGLLFGTAHAGPPSIDATTRAAVIDTLIKQLNDYYVFPEVAAKVETILRAKQQRGGYDSITDAEIFANVLTADLRDAGRDKHLRVRSSETPRSSATAPTPAQLEEMRKEMVARGYGIAKIETLAGNVGYLDLRGFDRIRDAASAITIAMTQLAEADALIVDVRNNGGGDPAGVAFLSSYLFDQRTHLNDLYWREGDRTMEFWTDIGVPGKHYGQKKAVYVLTGPRTFSGGEEFSYNLQQLKRATLIGEVTGGGANPGRMRELSPYFAAFIPNGRAINPITKTNWEGNGVTPDIKVPISQALVTAHKLALEQLAAASTDPHYAARLRANAAELKP
jgi:C-terminal processing protease CtpA/Prc